ncbi:class I SAM-dependent methyltransferase [Caenimonas koreensis]|nr:class I SAM-dependent methyltransferase [Caenimonas koreensis]
MQPACPFEPLDRLARFSWDWAPALCDTAHGCADYHRSWSLVRLLELGGALPAGQPFFTRELAEVARGSSRRVLVAGGADTGLTAMTIAAFRAQGSEPELVFVDRCRTTARQNELFAGHLRLPIDVQVCDAAAVDCAPVDAIVAHSFLHLLPHAKREEVIAAWSRVLKPGGRVVMSCAVSHAESDWVRAKDLAQVEQRRLGLQQRAGQAGFEPPVAAEIAATAARFWATSPGQAPALTQANLRASFARAGIEVRHIGLQGVEEVRGPLAITTRETSKRERAEVVAVRL